MNPDFIFETTAHVAAWLDGLDGIRLAEDAFQVEGAEPDKKLPAGRGKGKERTMAALRASRMAILKKRVGDGPDGPIPGARGAPVFAGGALEEISNGRIYWLDRYTVEWVLDAQKF